MMRWIRPAAAVLATIGVLAAAGCGGAEPQPAAATGSVSGAAASAQTAAAASIGAPSLAAVPAAVVELARQVVAPNTDGTPFVLVRTETLTPAEAAAAAVAPTSDEVASGTHGAPAYVLTFRGRFIGHGVSYPAGAEPPSGRYFTVGIDGAGPRVSGIGITQDEPAPVHRP